MYSFLQNLWLMGRIGAAIVELAVTRGYITRDQADEIQALPQG